MNHEEVEVNVIGHTEKLVAWPNASCGGYKGVAFKFSSSGAWVLPWEELERILSMKKPKPKRRSHGNRG